MHARLQYVEEQNTYYHLVLKLQLALIFSSGRKKDFLNFEFTFNSNHTCFSQSERTSASVVPIETLLEEVEKGHVLRKSWNCTL
jgi:hypothetical protein